MTNPLRPPEQFVPRPRPPSPMTSGKDIKAMGPPRASQHPNTARISAQNLSLLAKRVGRCGDINPLTGHVCVTQPHDTFTDPFPHAADYDPQEHMAVQIGGPNDGYVYARWR
jgi:hypothetical protein